VDTEFIHGVVKAVTKHGNSAGIILEQTILKMLGWEVGDEVEIRVAGGHKQ
jgi:antitoxin component of MazEF toxin-antitoxin module